MTNYPPGTSTRDLKRAGIIDEPVHCPECDNKVSHGENHEDWCECELSIPEMREYWAEEQMATEYNPVEDR